MGKCIKEGCKCIEYRPPGCTGVIYSPALDVCTNCRHPLTFHIG